MELRDFAVLDMTLLREVPVTCRGVGDRNIPRG